MQQREKLIWQRRRVDITCDLEGSGGEGGGSGDRDGEHM